MRFVITSVALLLTGCLACPPGAFAQGEVEDAPQAANGEDAKTDESDKGRFLALPIFITEPAIGEGLGAALVYFHGAPNDSVSRLETGRSIKAKTREQKPPPTATGVFAAYTNSDTHAVGIGHARTFKDDSYRMTAAAADAVVNATYYLGDTPFKFSADGALLFGNLKRRIGESNVFVGISASFVDADAAFGDDAADAGLFDFGFRDVGIAGDLIYDSRDDGMMPSSGQLVDLTAWKYDDAIGGDFDYWSATFKVNSFHKLGEKFVLGLRFEVSAADGEVPFYAEPFVPLRGIPALRYSGEAAGVVETELRYQFAKRWAVLGFVGKGFVNTGSGFEDTDDNIDAYGIGLRFQALKVQNIWLGLDLARGPEEDAFYVQMTHPW
jgi:hypothetical protein